MIANSYSLTDEPREASIHVAQASMFPLEKPVEVSAQEILKNAHISLYCLDFENRQAVFVETPPNVNLSIAPFYFIGQHEKAIRVLTISFKTMLELAETVSAKDLRLVFIHSVGRCGSTLASQIFSQVPFVHNMSEPDALTNVVLARNTHQYDEQELISLLQASVLLLCKNNLSKTNVIKGRSFVIELGDWLHTLFPHAKHLFLYRDAETWLQSGLRAFGREEELTNDEKNIREKEGRKHLGALVPAIAQFDRDRFLPHAGMLSLMWLTAMERYVQLCNLAIDTLAIRYKSWKQAPHETARKMLEFCECIPTDMTPIYKILNRDSQQGTPLARATIGQQGKTANKDDFDELHWHLKKHAFINTADFEVPNTWHENSGQEEVI